MTYKIGIHCYLLSKSVSVRISSNNTLISQLFDNYFNLRDMQEVNGNSKQFQEEQHLKLNQIAGRVSPRILDFYIGTRQLILAKQTPSLSLAISALSYPKLLGGSPICLKSARMTARVYKCIDCALIPDASFCAECFQTGFHKSHTYQTLYGFQGNCDCGNRQVLSPESFCPTHSINRIPEPAPNDQRKLFVEELKFALFILFKLKNHEQIFGLDHDSSLAYGDSLIQHLIQINVDSYQNNLLTYDLLQEKFHANQGYPELLRFPFQNTILSLLFELTDLKRVAKRVVKLFSALFSIEDFRRTIIYTYFSLISSEISYLSTENPYESLDYQFLTCGQLIQKMLKEGSLPPLRVNYKFTQARKLARAYEQLYDSYNYLLKLPNSSRLAAALLNLVPFSSLANFGHYFETLGSSDHLLLTGLRYARTAQKIVANLLKEPDSQNIFLSSFRSILRILAQKDKANFDFSLERTFGITLCAYLNGDVKSLIKLSSEELGELFGIPAPQLRLLVLQLWQQYLELASRDRQGIQSKIMSSNTVALDTNYLRFTCMDSFYSQILAILLINLTPKQEPSAEQVILRYFSPHLERIVKDITVNNAETEMLKIQRVFRVLISNFQTETPLIVIRIRLGLASPEQVHDFLSDLLEIYQGCSPIEFKAAIERFINDEEVISNFFRSYTVLDRNRIKRRGGKKGCSLNWTFWSLFAEKPRLQVIDKLQELKLKDNRQGTLSYVFLTDRTLKKALQIVEFFGEFIETHKQELGNIFQNLLAIHLESLLGIYMQSHLQGIFKNISELINKKYLGVTIPNVLETVLSRFQKHFAVNQEKQVNQAEAAEHEQKLQKKRDKLNAMKSKQKNTLQVYEPNTKEMEDQNQQTMECIICKNSKDGTKQLLMLAYIRFSDLVAGKLIGDTKPFIAINSCHHFMHEDCLHEAHKHQYRIWYPCFLCKTVANILLPIYKHNMTHKQKIETFICFLKDFSTNITQEYDNYPALKQFDVENVNGVFSSIFKMLSHQIAFYPFINLKHFTNFMFPTLQYVYQLLQNSAKLVQKFRLNEIPNPPAKEYIKNIYFYVIYRLETMIGVRRDGLADHYAAHIPTPSLELLAKILNALPNKHPLEFPDYKIPNEVHEKLQEEPVFQKIPHDLLQLRKLKVACTSCNSHTNHLSICFYCGLLICNNCDSAKKVHVSQKHFGEAVFICIDNGKVQYINGELVSNYESLFINYLGQSYQNANDIKDGQYTLSPQKYKKMLDDIWCFKIHGEVLKANPG